MRALFLQKRGRKVNAGSSPARGTRAGGGIRDTRSVEDAMSTAHAGSSPAQLMRANGEIWKPRWS